MADWNAIKTEYITTDTSYRKLEQKYGVRYNVIGERSRSEGWIEEREQYRATVVSKTIGAIGKDEVKRVRRLMRVTDKVLAKIEKLMDEDGAFNDPKAIRAIASALESIQRIQGVRAGGDAREQNARIANLEKAALSEDADNTVEIIISDELDSFTV
jgi:hypothetical protein